MSPKPRQREPWRRTKYLSMAAWMKVTLTALPSKFVLPVQHRGFQNSSSSWDDITISFHQDTSLPSPILLVDTPPQRLPLVQRFKFKYKFNLQFKSAIIPSSWNIHPFKISALLTITESPWFHVSSGFILLTFGGERELQSQVTRMQHHSLCFTSLLAEDGSRYDPMWLD